MSQSRPLTFSRLNKALKGLTQEGESTSADAHFALAHKIIYTTSKSLNSLILLSILLFFATSLVQLPSLHPFCISVFVSVFLVFARCEMKKDNIMCQGWKYLLSSVLLQVWPVLQALL